MRAVLWGQRAALLHSGQEAGEATLIPWLGPRPLKFTLLGLDSSFSLESPSLEFLLSSISPEFSLPLLGAGTELTNTIITHCGGGGGV